MAQGDRSNWVLTCCGWGYEYRLNCGGCSADMGGGAPPSLKPPCRGVAVIIGPAGWKNPETSRQNVLVFFFVQIFRLHIILNGYLKYNFKSCKNKYMINSTRNFRDTYFEDNPRKLNYSGQFTRRPFAKSAQINNLSYKFRDAKIVNNRIIFRS